MDLHVDVNLEKISELNGTKAEALFKYLKNVSKNKTPVLIKGVKELDHWNCDIYECQVPASHFSDIKLPAGADQNADGTELIVSLTDKLLSMFVPGNEYIFKDTKVVIKSGSTKVEVAQVYSKDTLEDSLNEFIDIINTNIENANSVFEIKVGSKTTDILREISSATEGCIFVSKTGITVLNGSVLFKAENESEFESKVPSIYINMYTANKLLATLDYCATAKLFITDSHTIIIGYDAEGREVVKNVSAIFETDITDLTDEDWAGLNPVEGSEIEVDLQQLLEVLSNHTGLISTFFNAKNLEVSLYKNGNGLSLSLGGETSDSYLTINVGDVSEPEPTADRFTKFATVLPLNTFKTLLKDNQSLKIKYDEDVTSDSAVLFESGEYHILSGKLI